MFDVGGVDILIYIMYFFHLAVVHVRLKESVFKGLIKSRFVSRRKVNIVIIHSFKEGSQALNNHVCLSSYMIFNPLGFYLWIKECGQEVDVITLNKIHIFF